MTTGRNSDLAATASQTAVRSKDGVSWVTTPINPTRVGDPPALGYRLRRPSLRAARLPRSPTPTQ